MKKIAIFIDGNNFYHNIKESIKPSKIDFNKLSKFICSKYSFRLIQVIYYNSVPNISDNCLKDEEEGRLENESWNTRQHKKEENNEHA